MDWSLILNFISVPAAIILGCLSFGLSLRNRKSKRAEELAHVYSQVGRISSIEVNSRAGTYDYGTLIRDNILNVSIIDNISSKCQKYGINGTELDQFLAEANSALANRHWDRNSANELVGRARDLQAEIK